MKTKLLASTLFVLTAATVFAYPLYQEKSADRPLQPIHVPPMENPMAQSSKIEVVFVLDTTGSMGGLIQAAKEKIWSIASSMASSQSAPEIKMGLVAYRDRGDDYVTRVTDLSTDLDSMYATLMDYQAQGGGDGPESVNQALHEAINNISWSQDSKTYKVVFLVGDAPPHMDYQDDVKYPVSLKLAKSKGIIVNTIQCGGDPNTHRKWMQVAQLGSGRYFQVGQNGSAVAISTPFDKKLAELSHELDKTRLYYGSKDELARKRSKLAATEKLHKESSVESRARRAAFNASKSGKENLLGKGELVEDVSSGRVALSSIEAESLPATVRALPELKQLEFIQKKADQRQKLEKQIKQIAQDRADYIREKVKDRKDVDTSLDAKLYDAVKEQAASKGLIYEAEAPAL